MDWQDSGIVLGARRQGENSVVLEVYTPNHGRRSGLVRGGRSKRMHSVIQPGNLVQVTWRARLEEHLGNFSVELLEANAVSVMNSAVSLHGFQCTAALFRYLPEREPGKILYPALGVIIEELQSPLILAELIVRLEVEILGELGFGLNLKSCVDTGQLEDLVYVSPKSGCAVSRQSGKPYHDRMLPLPVMLTANRTSTAPDLIQIFSGFRMTGYFLDRHVYVPRGIREPDSRISFINSLEKALSGDPGV